MKQATPTPSKFGLLNTWMIRIFAIGWMFYAIFDHIAHYSFLNDALNKPMLIGPTVIAAIWF